MPTLPVQTVVTPIARRTMSGTSALTARRAGRSIVMTPSPGRATSAPLSVSKVIDSPAGVRPVVHSAWALASVAWPQSGTSVTGVNQRRP